MQRRATAVICQAAGTSLEPMWVSETTPFETGQPYSLHLSASPAKPGIPGNFGWLMPKTGVDDFNPLLSHVGVTPEMLAANYVTVGETVTGLTGERVGQWVAGLDTRIAQADVPLYRDDTYTSFHRGNPRVMVIPVTEYVSGTGSGASFTVVRFAVFYLDAVNQGQKEVTGTFIQYLNPSAPASPGNTFTGISTSRLWN